MAPKFCCGNSNVSSGYMIAHVHFFIRMLIVCITLIRVDDTTNTFKAAESTTPTTTPTTTTGTATTTTLTTTPDPRHPLIIAINDNWNYLLIYCGVSCGIQLILCLGLCTKFRLFVAIWIIAALAELFGTFFLVIWTLGLPIPQIGFWIPYYPYLDQEMLNNTSAVMTTLVFGLVAINLEIWSLLAMWAAFLDLKNPKKKDIEQIDVNI